MIRHTSLKGWVFRMQRLPQSGVWMWSAALVMWLASSAVAQCICPVGTTEVDVSTVEQLADAIVTANLNPGTSYCIKLLQPTDPEPTDYRPTTAASPGTAFLVTGQVTIIGCGVGPAMTTITGPFLPLFPLDLTISCVPAENVDEANAIMSDLTKFRLFRVASPGVLQLINVTLRRGAALRTEGSVANGGAVLVQTGASFGASSCVFEQNVALTDGGAIYAEGPGASTEVTLTDCIVRKNACLRQGGGVFAQRNIMVLGGEFMCNFAGRPDLNDSQILNPNETSASGGAVYSDAAFLTIDRVPAAPVGTKFDRNRARNGGALFLTASGDRKIYAASFVRNAARLNGGAMFAQNVPVLLVGFSTFGGTDVADGNKSIQAGGAVYLQNFNKAAFPLMLGCRFENNTTDGNGGAVAHDSAVAGVYDQCFFRSNQADLNGGAVDARGASRPSFNDCVFVANEAGSMTAPATNGRGGALSFVDGRAITLGDADSLLYNCSFTRNRVIEPGAVGSGRGGTILIDNAAPWFLHCTIAYAASGNAGVYLVPPSLGPNLPRPRFDNSVFYPRIRPGQATPTEPAFFSSSGSLAYAQVRHSDVRGLAATDFSVNENNIDCDPLFVLSLGAPNGDDDVHLQECSPCIDRARQNYTNAGFAPMQSPPFRLFDTFDRPTASVGPEDFDYCLLYTSPSPRD